jgi:hypothetical protein
VTFALLVDFDHPREYPFKKKINGERNRGRARKGKAEGLEIGRGGGGRRGKSKRGNGVVEKKKYHWHLLEQINRSSLQDTETKEEGEGGIEMGGNREERREEMERKREEARSRGKERSQRKYHWPLLDKINAVFLAEHGN